MQERIGQAVEGNANAMEAATQLLEDGVELGAPRERMLRDVQVGRPAHRLVEAEPRCPAPLGVRLDPFGEHAAEKQRVVRDMGAQDVGLLGGTGRQLGQQIGNVGEAARGGGQAVVGLQLAGVRKGEQDGGDVVGQRALVERDLPQNAPRQDIKIESR